MWEILGYVVFVAVFVSISCVVVTSAPTAATARRRFALLCGISFAIASLLYFLGRYTELFRPVLSLLMFSWVLSDLLFIRPLLRRRVIPPCVRVRAFSPGRWLVIMGLPVLVLVLTADLVLWRWTTLPADPDILVRVSFCGLIIGVLCQRAEICANGVWYYGGLHEWSSFECFAWREQGDKTVVELVYSKELRSQVSPSAARVIVPPENREAAKKLLEANLVSSAPEAARA